ncbi:MAG: flagellar M-ring protein FliF [Acidobacteria bacterium]|nr:flagellar M-ring protein FliF [Acidobacteriota bacterium]
MNPDQLLAHLKKLATTLSAKQILGLASAFVAVVAVVVGSAYWINQPSYTLLVADMDAETATAVVSKLKAGRIPYELGDGGRTVSVPAERVDELRLDLASGGLPSAGRIGFEIFDRPAFGTTEFLEHVNYRRALEGELARTIGTLAEVSSARVHIAMAKESLFVDQEQPAKASVVLKLRGNRPLAASTVKGIQNLVSGSVEALRPESVVILDTFGRPLTRPQESDDALASSAQGDRQQQIERDLTAKVVSLLEPVVGAGRVRVNVSAQLNPDSVEQTEEHWDPTTVLRSRQSSSEGTAAAASAAGVAGARANQPPALSTAAAPAPAAAAPVAALSGPGRVSETANYEVGRVTRHTVSPQGALARLSVAVILDDERVTSTADGATKTTTRPWDPQGLQRIQGLVSAAVGFNQDRGDQLTVENIAFDATPLEAAPAEPTIGQQVLQQVKLYWPAALRLVGVVGIAFVALFGVIRPLTRAMTSTVTPAALPAPAGASARLPTVKEMEGQIEAELDGAANGQGRRLPVLTKRVAKLANEEPEQLARIVRGWIAEDER